MFNKNFFNYFLLIFLFIFNINNLHSEEKDINYELACLKSKMEAALNFHKNNDYKNSILLYETLKIRIAECKQVKDVYSSTEIEKYKKNINDYLKNDSFYATNNIYKKQIQFPDKTENILALAWITNDGVKVALTNISKTPIEITLKLGYPWKNNQDAEYGIDEITKLDIYLSPNILTEVTINGIPNEMKENDYYKNYYSPGVFIEIPNSGTKDKKLQSIFIQGIKNAYLDIDFAKYYYFSPITFTYTMNIKSQKKSLDYTLYYKKNAHFVQNKNNIHTEILNYENNNNIQELKNGQITKNFPLEIKVKLEQNSTKESIDLIYFDTMILDIKNSETNTVESVYIPTPQSFILNNNNPLNNNVQIKSIVHELPSDKQLHVILQDNIDNKIKELVERLDIDYWNVSWKSEQELIKTGKDAVPALLKLVESNAKNSRQLLKIIGYIGDPALPDLLAFTHKISEEVDLQLYEDIAHCYALIGRTAIPTLLDLTKDKQLSKTIFVAMALNEIKDHDKGIHLLKILESINKGYYLINPSAQNFNIQVGREKFLKKLLIHSIGDVQYKPAVPILINIINTDPSDDVLEEISYALGRIKDQSSIDYLYFLAESGYKEGVNGLREMKDFKSLPLLIKKFITYSPETQIEIIKMCIENNDVKNLDKLIIFYDDTGINSNVKEFLGIAIEKISSKI